MNQQCKVCGEPAAGFHFGAFTCEGCKSFFGRSYNNLGSISECKNNGECVINKKNRTSCKACRLRKCLLVGMSKSGSRYGRRSNWFKIHCLLQEQQQQQQQHQQQQQNHLHQQQVGRQQRSPPHPSALGILGHHQAQQGNHPHFDPRLHHQLAAAMSHHHHQRAKEDLMLLGLDEYKNSTSPSISSPESHNSDSSVEVSDQRLASRTASLFKESASPAAHKDGMFVPLPFATLASLAPSVFPHAAAAAAAAFLQPSAFAGAGAAGAPFLFPTHGGYVYPPAGSHKQHGHQVGVPKLPTTHASTLNNNTIDAAAGKRFFLDAILQSQRVSPPSTPRGAMGSDVDADDDGNEVEDDASSSHHSPSLLLSDQEQENPMDLSMKGCRIRAEERRSLSPGGFSASKGSAAGGCDEDDEGDTEGDGDADGHRSDSGLSHGCGADVDDAEGLASLPHRTTPIDLTTKA